MLCLFHWAESNLIVSESLCWSYGLAYCGCVSPMLLHNWAFYLRKGREVCLLGTAALQYTEIWNLIESQQSVEKELDSLPSNPTASPPNSPPRGVIATCPNPILSADPWLMVGSARSTPRSTGIMNLNDAGTFYKAIGYVISLTTHFCYLDAATNV